MDRGRVRTEKVIQKEEKTKEDFDHTRTTLLDWNLFSTFKITMELSLVSGIFL